MNLPLLQSGLKVRRDPGLVLLVWILKEMFNVNWISNFGDFSNATFYV